MEESPKKETRGRKPGQLNPRTKLRMGMMERMFRRLGGEEAHFKWCQKHEDFFREEYIKMQIKEHLNKDVTLTLPQGASVKFEMILSGTDND